MARRFIKYFGICSIPNDIKRSPESLEHTRMDCSMIKIVEVLNKVFIEIITEILECTISSFISKIKTKSSVFVLGKVVTFKA